MLGSHFYIYITGILIISACVDSKQETANEATIQERIQTDLNTDLTTSGKFELHRKNLPKTVYYSDKDHSSISFRTKHWEIVDLIGWFENFQVVMYSDSTDFSDAVIYAEVDVTSIRMPNEKMMGSVQHAPYIDSKKFGIMKFRSESFTPISDTLYHLKGILEVNGIQNPMEWEVSFNGFAYPNEQAICGFSFNGLIDRRAIGIAIEETLHSGRLIHDPIIEVSGSLRME